jgi:organic radical activating enzyme
MFPINEIFTSLQGEGTWTGTRMTFVRFAGCTVGRPYTQAARASLNLPAYIERCTDWMNAGFPCDTNYRRRFSMTVAELMHEIAGAERVCVTGGEPLMHDIGLWMASLVAAGVKVHLETSGTIPLPGKLEKVWVCVSPKADYLESMLERADEIKVLVGENFSPVVFFERFGRYLEKVWVQPVNGEHEIDPVNLRRCVNLAAAFSKIRVSTQNHKIWKVR